jgi:4-oxalocrotonate tautomerase
MPIITINLLEGRPAAKKQRLIREVSEAAARSLDVPISTVRIVLSEVALEHWGVGGISKADAPSPTSEKEQK